ncbi:MAG: hypothetical protein LBR57_03305 [Alistipes sp.]|jgi:hypothetical protein|nr:hypothetical protein [Alistipes sp.]
MREGKIFKIEVKSNFAGWERYAVFMTAVCFGADGTIVDYVNQTDNAAVLETPPCDHADLYIYVIAREFPASDVISKSPPFDIDLVVSTNDQPPRSTAFAVNQWGGLSVKQSLS